MKKSDNNNDELFPKLPEIESLGSNIDRRTFIIRNAVIGAAAVMTGTTWTREARGAQAAKEAATKQAGGKPLGSELSPNLNVVKESKGPVMTVADEFYKVGPGPSSSHTIGPMRITYDFLSALHQAAGGPAIKSDRVESSSLRKSERDGQRSRHGARRLGRFFT